MKLEPGQKSIYVILPEEEYNKLSESSELKYKTKKAINRYVGQLIKADNRRKEHNRKRRKK